MEVEVGDLIEFKEVGFVRQIRRTSADHTFLEVLIAGEVGFFILADDVVRVLSKKKGGGDIV